MRSLIIQNPQPPNTAHRVAGLPNYLNISFYVYVRFDSLLGKGTIQNSVSLSPPALLIMALLVRSLLRRASSSNRFSGGIGGAVWRRWMSQEADAAAGYHLSGGPAYMRGAVFWEPNKPLTIEDFRMPRPKAGEILIKTKGRISTPLTTTFCFCLEMIA